jgi:hypothetical protein
MPINLLADKYAAKGKIAKVGSPRRHADDPDSLIFDLDVAFKIENQEQAEIAAQYAPGLMRLWQVGHKARNQSAAEVATNGAAEGAKDASEHGTFGDLSIKMPENMRTFAMSVKTDDGEVELGDVELRSLKYKSSAKTSTLVMKVRIKRCKGETIGLMADHLDLLGTVAIVRKQQNLPGTDGSVINFPTAAADPEPGQVVSGVDDGVEYAGIVVDQVIDEDNGSMLVIDDCGTERLVRLASVSGRLDVVVNKGRGKPGTKLNAAVSRFKDAASDAGIEPTWRYLVVALGEHYLNEGADAEWVLTDEIIEAAVARVAS